MSGLVEQAAKDRIEGDRPGRLRSLVAAAMAGVAAGALAYKFLRDESDGGGGEQSRTRMRAPRRQR
jgi:hypothetical protein